MLDELLSDEGWAYASTPPVEPRRPRPLPRAVRPRLADHRAAGAAGAARRGRARRCARSRRCRGAATTRRPTRSRARSSTSTARRPRRASPSSAGRCATAQLRYYGSADSTPWFLVVLAALGDAALSAELEPAWRAAAGWLERALERGGGLVRYGPRTSSGGLVQQGWRDAAGAGRATPRRRRDPARGRRDARRRRRPTPTCRRSPTRRCARSRELRRGGVARRAEALAERIERDFGPDVMALEADDRAGPRRRLPARLAAVVGRAPGRASATRPPRGSASPTCSRAFGLRTLARPCPVFDPQGYHRGSIWPFDSWLGWGGLRAAGRDEEAERVRSGVLAALDELGQRARALRGHARGRARAVARRQPRPGVDAWARAGRSSTAGTGAARPS